MTGWLADDPGAGDPAAVLARARALDTLVRLLDRGRSEYREQLETVSPDVWFDPLTFLGTDGQPYWYTYKAEWPTGSEYDWIGQDTA